MSSNVETPQAEALCSAYWENMLEIRQSTQVRLIELAAKIRHRFCSLDANQKKAVPE